MNKDETVELKVDPFLKHGDSITLELEGHQTLYADKGKNGNLTVKVHVSTESERWRDNNDIHTVHFVTLGQALDQVSLQNGNHLSEQIAISRHSVWQSRPRNNPRVLLQARA